MTSFFATAVPGIGPILAEELAGAGLSLTATGLHDGRNDIVGFEAKGTAALDGIRTAEDLFVQLAASTGGRNPTALADALCQRDALDRALSVAAGQGHPLPANTTYRVIARVLSERGFPRTALRDAMASVVAKARPRWRPGDPAKAELWVLETAPNDFRLGLRLTPAGRRQHGGRVEERAGSLRPTVAAAMVRLASSPPDGRGRLLFDPCCGSGTIIAEAVAAGWIATGGDIDPAAVASAVVNLRRTAILQLDSRNLPLPRAAFDAVVSNLPFGHTFPIDDKQSWYPTVIGECAAVTRRGGRVVLLGPREVGDAAGQERGLRQTRRLPVQILGRGTTLWSFDVL